MRQRDALLSKCVRLGDYAQAAVTGALSAAERSYPTSEVRGSGRECQAVMAQERPRGATPCLRSEAAARRSNPMPEARDSGREQQLHVQGVVAAWAQDGLEEPSHVEGQEGQR